MSWILDEFNLGTSSEIYFLKYLSSYQFGFFINICTPGVAIVSAKHFALRVLISSLF